MDYPREKEAKKKGPMNWKESKGDPISAGGISSPFIPPCAHLVFHKKRNSARVEEGRLHKARPSRFLKNKEKRDWSGLTEGWGLRGDEKTWPPGKDRFWRIHAQLTARSELLRNFEKELWNARFFWTRKNIISTLIDCGSLRWLSEGVVFQEKIVWKFLEM